jgi:hypothetical protein
LTETVELEPPSADDVRQEDNPTRKAVLAAIIRMLDGRPTVVPPGRLSVAALAREAGIDRAKLTTGAVRDLGSRFSAIVEAQSSVWTQHEIALNEELGRVRAQHKKLQKRHAELQTDRDKWKAAATSFARAVQVLKIENTNQSTRINALERRMNREGNVSDFPLRPMPPDEN